MKQKKKNGQVNEEDNMTMKESNNDIIGKKEKDYVSKEKLGKKGKKEN